MRPAATRSYSPPAKPSVRRESCGKALVRPIEPTVIDGRPVSFFAEPARLSPEPGKAGSQKRRCEAWKASGRAGSHRRRRCGGWRPARGTRRAGNRGRHGSGTPWLAGRLGEELRRVEAQMAELHRTRDILAGLVQRYAVSEEPAGQR